MTTTQFCCVLAYLLLPVAQAAAAAKDVRFSSGPARTVMIELYTSEGCNSCPPAEAWLNQLKHSPALWETYFPLAYHVDYWDYLGWRDRFSQPAHSQRQRQYARIHNARTVYTPAFIVNGREWRRSGISGVPDGGGEPAGRLTVVLKGRQLEATFQPLNPAPEMLHLNIAILGMGLTSEIRAGENAGRRAQHEFVVLARQQLDSGSGHWRGRVPVPENDFGASRLALVAWVSKPGDPTPRQATGGYVNREAMQLQP